MTLTPQQVTDFQEKVWEYFRAHERPMPWRDAPTPYHVLVSELMLQQTQVPRVIPKFEAFIKAFPDIKTLAAAPLSEVLIAWSGLGYNRRAKFLHETAKTVASEQGGNLPDTLQALVALPGIGPNTAGAILAYAYEQPVTFIETNVRTVLFHHFFADDNMKVADKELTELATQLLDKEHPREWHWALMDYGTYLKKTVGGRLKSSSHYKKQSPLKGSPREMRGRILRALTIGSLSDSILRAQVRSDHRYEKALEDLEHEGLILRKGDAICLTGHTDAR